MTTFAFMLLLRWMRALRLRIGGLLALASVAGMLAAANPALASNGAMAISNSPKAAGTGGAGQAMGGDGYSLNTNPAGLAGVRRSRFDLGLSVWGSDNQYRSPASGSGRADPGPTVVPGAAVSAPLDFGGRANGWDGGQGRVVIGFGMFVLGGAGGSWTARNSLYPEGFENRSQMPLLAGTVGIGFELTPRLRLGFALERHMLSLDSTELTSSRDTISAGTVIDQQSGKPVLVNQRPVNFTELFAAGGRREVSAPAIAEIRGAKAEGWGGRLGLQLSLSPNTSLGFGYALPTELSDLEGRAHLDASRGVPALLTDPLVAGAAGQNPQTILSRLLPRGGLDGFSADYKARLSGIQFPEQWSAGLLHRFENGARLLADVRFIRWSRAFKAITATLSGGSNPDVNAIQGSDMVQTTKALGWGDQLVLALGVDLPAGPWRCRLGYNYGNDPSPVDTASPGGAPLVEHHLTAGLGRRLGRWDMDLALVWGLPGKGRVGRHASNPLYDDTKVEVQQFTLMLGVAMGF